MLGGAFTSCTRVGVSPWEPQESPNLRKGLQACLLWGSATLLALPGLKSCPSHDPPPFLLSSQHSLPRTTWIGFWLFSGEGTDTVWGQCWSSQPGCWAAPVPRQPSALPSTPPRGCALGTSSQTQNEAFPCGPGKIWTGSR